MKFNLRKSRGFTLVELLLVVGIIALGSVVAYTTLPKVQTNLRTTTEVTNINTLVAGIKNSFGAKTNFASLTTNGIPFVVKAKIVPEKMIVNNTTLINNFGGSVFVGVETFPVGVIAANATFRITYNGVPDAVCNRLAMNVASRTVRSTVNGTFIKSGPGDFPTELTLNTVAAQCSLNDNNSMQFWFN